MKEITHKVIEFLNTPGKRMDWLEDQSLRVYVRKAKHIGPQQTVVQTLDIANVLCHDPGKKYFTGFLDELEKLSPFPIYIESVQNERLEAFLVRRGYRLVPNSEPPSYFREKSKEPDFPAA